MRRSSYTNATSLSRGMILAALGAACGTESASERVTLVRGPVATLVAGAATRQGVPVDLALAVAAVEGGLRLPAFREPHLDDLVVVAGAMELRRGKLDTLALGAALTGLDEETLVADHAAGTEAGAAVLAQLAHDAGVDPTSLEAWAPVVEKMSGHRDGHARAAYRARVFALLRNGATVRARAGETVVIDPHPEVPVALTIVPPEPEILGGTPDYPTATWIETSCTDKCNTSRNAEISMIAIHDTEGGWEASVATLQNDPGKSVHYIVDADGGRVAQFIPEQYNGWHVGNSYYNNRMIGIEHVGFAAEDDYQTEMVRVSAELVKDIAARHDIPLDRRHVVGHQEVPDGDNIAQSSPPCSDSPGTCIASGNYGGFGHHHDPGVNWEWCQYMELVGGRCKCNDTFELWNCVHDLSMMNRCNGGEVEIVHCADACVVEPIGTDDHCTESVPTSSTAAVTTAAATTVSQASTSSAGLGPDSAGGAGGAGDDAASNDGCDCAVGVPRSPSRLGPALLALAGLAGLAALRRRRR